MWQKFYYSLNLDVERCAKLSKEMWNRLNQIESVCTDRLHIVHYELGQISPMTLWRNTSDRIFLITFLVLAACLRNTCYSY